MGEFATVKTSVWWDIENCPVPRGCDPERIVQNMSSALATAGYRGPISVSAYGDTCGIGKRVQHALCSTGVTLNHVPAGIKDASDKRILVDMLFWAIDNPPPANYLLISGDRDFSNAIHKLKMRRYNILLAHPPNVSQTLCAAAKSVWPWKSLVAGEPPLAQSPFISSTSSHDIYDIDIPKNIASNYLNVKPHTNPQMHGSLLCDHQSGSNGKSDKQHKVNQPQENQPDRLLKPASKKKHERGKSVDIGSTPQPALKKAKIYKGGSCTAEHLKPPILVPENSRLVPGQGLICFKCGAKHFAAVCSFNGDCLHCGEQGHDSRVCKRNPDCIIKWEPKLPKPAHNRGTSSPGSVHKLPISPVSQLPPAASSPNSVHTMAASLASQSPRVTLSSGLAHIGAADPASRLSPAASSPGSAHMTASPSASHLSSVLSPPGSIHSRVCPMPTIAPSGTNVVTVPTSLASCPPAVVPALLCFKCGGGHSATGCTWAGAFRRCGQQDHIVQVCPENPDNINECETAPVHGMSPTSQSPSHGLSGASHSLVNMMLCFPHSQLPPGWMPLVWWFWQAALAMRPPLPRLPLDFVPPQPGVAVSSAPAHSGVYTLPMPTSLGGLDMVAGATVGMAAAATTLRGDGCSSSEGAEQEQA